MVKISIIIPVYNVENYLRDCLESVLRQNFTDMELICVEGDSSDHSLDILKEYAEKDQRIKIISQQRGKGLSDARNIGMRYAKGKYIWFVDSDDMIVENACVELYNMAEQYDTDILYFHRCNLYEVENHLRQDEVDYIDYPGIMSGRELFCKFQRNKDYRSGAWEKLLKKDFLLDNNLSFCEGILAEDILFSFECAMVAQRVMDINKKYYIYRRRYGSLMYEQSARIANSFFVVLSRIYVYWNTHNFSMEENKAIQDHFYHWSREYRFRFSSYKNNTATVGNYPEQILYRLLCEGLEPLIKPTEEQIFELRKARFIILYGAGRAAVDILYFLQKKEINVNVIAVSALKDNPDNICGIKVYCIDDLTMYKDAPVIVGVTAKYADTIVDTLKSKGFKSIINMQDCTEPA